VITFKSTEDLAKLPATDPAYPTVLELVDRLITAYTEPDQPYNHEDYGYVILMEEGDAERTLDEVWDGCTLLGIYWEGTMLRDGFFIAIYLADNEYGLVFVIPDAPWVDGDLRRMIEDTLDPIPETHCINSQGEYP
jgi:tRNA uridine 5-carbamoylmethylation protein Kti12